MRSTRGTFAIIAIGTLVLVGLPFAGSTATAAPTALAPTAANYTFSDLGADYTPTAINNSGFVTAFYNGRDPINTGFWHEGQFTAVISRSEGGYAGGLPDINESGDMLGTVDHLAGFGSDGGVPFLANVASSSSRRSVPWLSSGYNLQQGEFVNDSGAFVVSATAPQGTNSRVDTALYYASTTASPVEIGSGFGALAQPHDETWACGISNSGVILAQIGRSTGVSFGQYLLPSATVAPSDSIALDFSTVCNNLYSIGHPMSKNGTLVGQRTSDRVPVLRTPNGTETVVPGVTQPLSVNDLADVVGVSGADGKLVQHDGTVTDLRSLMPAGWSSVLPRQIDNAGDIIGVGDIGGVTHGFILMHKRTPGLTVAPTSSPTSPRVGQAVAVTATITNTGDGAVSTIVPSLSSTPAAHLTIGAPSPSSITSLAAGASTTVTWTVTADQAATYSLAAQVGWTDPALGARTQQATLPLVITGDGLVVNSTGDAAATDAALTTKNCDTDDTAAGNQCTLRAAIQVANLLGADGTTQLVTFDIPAAGTPRITPASLLPSLTAPAVLDASTQAGGWVEVSGASSTGDGLTVTGGGTTIRGFVLNGFASGSALTLSGGGYDTVVGNRIGTNVAGTAAVANKVGISLKAPDATIGALTSDGQLLCHGDCNVISGNSDSGIRISGSAVAARSRISGDVIGTDPTGRTAVRNATGIKADPTVSVSSGDEIQIGGTAASPGIAPGNLISGNGTGLDVGAYSVAHQVSIRGNLVGSDWSGTTAVANTSRGVSSSGRSDVVGGPDAGDRNVIVGSPVGLDTFGIARQNLIGISFTGMVIPNAVGATTRQLGKPTFCDNVISGNQIGLESYLPAADEDQTTSQGSSISLAGGNRIGTDATGQAAAGNSIGVLGSVQSVRIEACPGSGPDVISGNADAGVRSAPISGYPFAWLSDAYVGTDVTGKRAIPNGTGIDAPEISVWVGRGRTGAGVGFLPCAAPCVIVSGNSGVGIRIGAGGATTTSSSFVLQNSFVGVGADGGPVGNGGDGVQIDRPVVAVTDVSQTLSLSVGLQNNVIANNAGIGIHVLASPTPPSGYPIRDNAISSNAGGGILLANGANFWLSKNSIHDNPFGVKVAAGTAPELVGNSFSNNALGYQVILGTDAPGAPAGLTVQRIGTSLVLAGSRPAGTTGAYRIDVYGDAACTTGAQGSVYLSSVTVPSSLFSTDFSLHVSGVPSSTTGIEVAATDISSSTPSTPGSTSLYTGCVTPAATTQRAAVSATTVAAGNAVTVTGSGFAPGEQVDVSLHSDPVHLAVVTADANGDVSAFVTIPRSTPPGLHHIVLTGGTSGATAEVAITVTGVATALASTGVDPLPLASAAVALLLLGLVLRRQRRSRPRPTFSS